MKQETVFFPTVAPVTTTSATTDINGKPINGVNADVNSTEADLVEFVASAVLGAGETITANIVTSAGTLVPAQTITGVPAVLDPTHQSMLVPGGFLYRIVKTATVAPTGLDFNFKPRNK